MQRGAAAGSSRAGVLAYAAAAALGLIALLIPPNVPGPPPSSILPPMRAVAMSRLPFDAPLVRPPLDPPLVLNGGFGEFRSNHFHAGLDLGTGGQVGRPVFATLAGWIERVRASGVGYGRSLYLRADDGRSLVFAHLDALVEPLASFVAAAQESTGQYEQDLWPERGRFRVTAGQSIAWTGESGSGGPHLHFEIRRGDMALNPLRAGLAIADTSAPTIDRITLEPLDDASFVERGAAPWTARLRAAPETVLVQGRVRAVVGVRDGVWKGVDRMVPWSASLEVGGEWIECRFDSVSWATDMAESDYVYDAGRITGDRGIVLWAPSGFRSRVIHSNAPMGNEAGTIVVQPGDLPRVLKLSAQDLAGQVTERTIVLRGPSPHEIGPDTTRSSPSARSRGTQSERRLEFTALPGGYMRVELIGAPPESRGVWLESRQPGRGRRASLNGDRWSIVIPPELFGDLVLRGRDAAGLAWEHGLPFRARLCNPTDGPGARGGSVEDGELFEQTSVIIERRDLRPHPPGRELVPMMSGEVMIGPETTPLRKPARIRKYSAREWGANVGIYHLDGDSWNFMSRTRDSSGTPVFVAETRRLGTFAVFADTLAPRIAPLRPPRRAVQGPYSRWALEARLTDAGSGVNARATRFEVDGKRVPSEWDSEQGILRWRPRRAPAKGGHRYTVIATDRAENERRASGRFVVE